MAATQEVDFVRIVGAVRDGQAMRALVKAMEGEPSRVASRCAMREVVVAREEHACFVRLRRAVTADEHAAARSAAREAGAARRYAWWRATADDACAAQWTAWEAWTRSSSASGAGAAAWAAADAERALARRVDDDDGGQAQWLVSQEVMLDVPVACRLAWHAGGDGDVVAAKVRAALTAVHVRLARAVGAAPKFWEGALAGGWCSGDPLDGGRTALHSAPATVTRQGAWIDMHEFRVQGAGGGVVVVRVQEELREGDVVGGRSATRPPLWVHVDCEVPRKRSVAGAAPRPAPDFERIVRMLTPWVHWVAPCAP